MLEFRYSASVCSVSIYFLISWFIFQLLTCSKQIQRRRNLVLRCCEESQSSWQTSLFNSSHILSFTFVYISFIRFAIHRKIESWLLLMAPFISSPKRSRRNKSIENSWIIRCYSQNKIPQQYFQVLYKLMRRIKISEISAISMSGKKKTESHFLFVSILIIYYFFLKKKRWLITSSW